MDQLQRAELRRRFFQVRECMEGKQIEIETYRGATVNGKFRSVDFDISGVHVSCLNTPIGCIPEALVRTSDIVKINFELD